MPLLEIRNVTRRFGALTAIDDVTLSIEAGEFFTLLGPSGCGKTTLLRMIAGFDAPNAGSIWLEGADLADKPPEERPVHTVPVPDCLDGCDPCSSRLNLSRHFAERVSYVRRDGIRLNKPFGSAAWTLKSSHAMATHEFETTVHRVGQV